MLRGLIVAPGFIDIHNHSDYSVLTDGNAESMIRQGVTSMIFGEGGSVAPLGGKQDDKGREADWTDLQGYFATLLRKGVSTNIGTYVGSSQIWTYVRGPRPGPPDARRIRSHAAAGPPCDAAGRSWSCEFFERSSGSLD